MMQSSHAFPADSAGSCQGAAGLHFLPTGAWLPTLLEVRAAKKASQNGLKFTAQSAGKDVAVQGWIFKDAFAEYKFDGAGHEHLHMKLPVAPLLSCLTIFSERAALTMRRLQTCYADTKFRKHGHGTVGAEP
ncbi:unnamed protein product [Effrenium voratum]|uniref:Uncharacterized protein n=1 Tax=Effrenium voratum TaxID=2562239 RepID=A0AA36MRF5_9DINO|nr:unnamed protein product [Effrenium voratum]